VHLVTRDEVSVAPFDPPYTKTPCYTQTSWLCFVEAELWPIELLQCGNTHFVVFFAPATLTLIRWPSYTNVTIILSRQTGCANVNFLRQGFRKLLSSDIQTDRQTDRHGRNYIPRRLVKNTVVAN